MRKFILNLLNEFTKNRLTIMFIPHTNSKPKSISIPFNLVYIIGFFLFILVFFILFSLFRNINYMNALGHNFFLENKLEYFSNEIIKNKKFLNNNFNKNINSNMVEPSSVGGPELIDELIVRKLVSSNINISINDFSRNIDRMDFDIKKQMKTSKTFLRDVLRKQKIANALPSIWPVRGHITSNFGYRIHPLTGKTIMHAGLDIGSRFGSSVVATADGTVIYAGLFGGYGKLVIVKHSFGYSTFYAHLSKIVVFFGKKIKKGEIVGLVGNTGMSTGPHLHYEVRYKNNPQNPMKFLIKNRA